MLLRHKPKPPLQDPPRTRKNPLETDPLVLSERGSLEAVHSYLAENPAEADVQDALSARFYSASHWRSNLRVFIPLAGAMALSCAGRIVNDDFGGPLSPPAIAAGFVGAVFISALIGRSRSIAFDRRMSARVESLIGGGRITSEGAQERLCSIIADGQDASVAFRLLFGGKIAHASVQLILADVIYKHGTKDQAKQLLENCPLAETARGTIKLKCPDD
ncbi:MAG: hypothetical protein U0R44_03765 [Candidatus Micrarchaeia archaeon]